MFAASKTAAVSTAADYIEDVFSTYLYTGDGSGQTITNGIDLAGEGGLVWIKSRQQTTSHVWVDSARGYSYLESNSNQAENGSSTTVSSFNNDGFSVSGSAIVNGSGYNYVSWVWRNQAKFFDCGTYTGNGTAGRTVSHNLGSTPGFLLVKRTDTGGSTGQNWAVWHRSAGGTGYFNSTNALDSSFPNSIFWGDGSSYVAPTSTTFTVTTSQNVNASGGTYVYYAYAHNAGGFGLTATDNVISCGSFSLDSAVGIDVNLGYEAQWVMIKRTDSSAGSSGWYLLDTMRGWTVDQIFGDKYLQSNTTSTEAGQSIGYPTSTGFAIQASTWLSTGSYIYVAIRRGPMKVPTYAPSVFYSSSFGDTQTSFPTGFVTDFAINKVTYYNPDLGTYTDGSNLMLSRLTANRTQATNQGTTESNLDPSNFWDIQDGYRWANGSGYSIFGWAFARAPSFADVVCYTGTYPTVNTVTHNLGVAPELMFVKLRTGVNRDWAVYSKAYSDYLGLQNRYGVLNTTVSLLQTSTDVWNNTAPTATSFQVNATDTNYNGGSLIAYLFATCPGVSKCGLFTGTGSTQTIDCGFTGGARFVMIKRANTTGDWFVYDSSRGIQSGNDPYLLWNSSNPAVLNTNYVDAASGGFQVIGSGLNVSGGIYIFWAIA